MPGAHLNSTARAVAIIEFLATRPKETFSLSEIARRVDIHKSTAYTTVRTLHEAGWLFRSPTDLHYGLGPTLTAVGRAADQATPHLSLARPVMHQLASELRRECVFSTMTGDEVLVLDTTGPIDLSASSTRPGQRTPCLPPFGRIFVAYQDEASQKAWLARGAVLDRGRSAELASDLRAIRKRGFAATLKSNVHAQWAHALQELPESISEGHVWELLRQRLDQLQPGDYMAGDDETADPPTISTVHAPIFEDGDARYALTVLNIDQGLDAKSLNRLGKRVRAACDEITAAIAKVNTLNTKGVN